MLSKDNDLQFYLRQKWFDGREIELYDVGDLEQGNTIVSIVDNLLDSDLESTRYPLANLRENS